MYALCKELISTCVVVGTDRPSPALLVEPLPVNMGKQEITRCIAERVASINAGGYPHEQIFQDHILVVSKGELPRTSVSVQPTFLLNKFFYHITSSNAM